MSAIWQFIICAILSLTAIVGGASLGAMSFAIASFRFLNLKDKDSNKESLSGVGKFCVYNSERMASVISLGRKFFLAVATLSMYFSLTTIDELFQFEHTTFFEILLAFISAVLVLFIQYTFFEIPATRIGRNYPMPTIRKLGTIMYITFIVFVPIEIVARFIVKRILPKKLKKLESGFDYIDVEMMLRADENDTESISQYTGKIVKNAFRIQELDVSDVMLPRTKIVYFDTEKSNSENLKLALGSHHTRYPLCNKDLDDCIGIIHIKDIFTEASETDIELLDYKSLCRETLRVRENEKLESALAKLLKYKLQMALVEDEFGGVIGVLTLDSAVGELVGQMRPEFGEKKNQSIKQLSKNKYKVGAMTALRRVEDFLDVDFETDEVSTFGGLITFLLGRFPEKGERLYIAKLNMRIIIDSVEDKMVGDCTVILEDNNNKE